MELEIDWVHDVNITVTVLNESSIADVTTLNMTIIVVLLQVVIWQHDVGNVVD